MNQNQSGLPISEIVYKQKMRPFIHSWKCDKIFTNFMVLILLSQETAELGLFSCHTFLRDWGITVSQYTLTILYGRHSNDGDY